MARSAVAEALRSDLRTRQPRRTPAEQVLLSLALGDEAAELYAQAHGVSVRTARNRLRAAAQAGRRRSVAAR